jgi:anaerobic selenocysteine-containing dehydrogenase
MAEGLDHTDLVVSYDLFMSDTARRFADVVLPGTAWLEELGCKATNTHLYLMEQALAPPGETRPLSQVLRGLVLSARNTERVCNEERPDIRQSFPLLPNWKDVRDARPSTQVCDQAHARARGAAAAP